MSNSKNNGGLLGMLSFGLLGNKKNKTVNAKNKVNATNTKKNGSVMPVTAGVPNIEMEEREPNQTGGMAPVNFRYPPNMQQPSYEVMRWATTAGVPTPTGPQMRNVAHGGKRRTIRRKSKRSTGGRKRHTMKHKTHRRKYHKRVHTKRRN